MVAFLLDDRAGYPVYIHWSAIVYHFFLNIMVGDLSTINLSLCMWVKQYQHDSNASGASQSASAGYQLLWVGFCVLLIYLR